MSGCYPDSNESSACSSWECTYLQDLASPASYNEVSRLGTFCTSDWQCCTTNAQNRRANAPTPIRVVIKRRKPEQ